MNRYNSNRKSIIKSCQMGKINNNLIDIIMELKIKTFVQDCKRPNWLLALLMEVTTYLKRTDLKPEDVSSTFTSIKSSMESIPYVKRNARYRLSDCVKVEEVGNKMTIYTVFKDIKMVEFTIE